MNSADPALDDLPLDATVYHVVRANIAAGVLPPGTPLTEYRLALELAVSREPIGRALDRLEQERFIERDAYPGYIVRGASRLAGRTFPQLDVSPAFAAVVRGRTEWQKVWDRVLGDLVGSMPFGRFKVVESTMAVHYAVSRTVTRDLLARLEAQGVIEREGRSQCYLRQLTSQLLSELYEVRQLLEPRALLGAAPFIEAAELARMRDDLDRAAAHYPATEPELLTRCETDLHVGLIKNSPNGSLVALVRQSQQLALATNRLLPLYLGMPAAEPFIAEHRQVVDYLLNGNPQSAALALEAHLRSAESKQQRRLVQLQSFEPKVPPYLINIQSRS